MCPSRYREELARRYRPPQDQKQTQPVNDSFAANRPAEQHEHDPRNNLNNSEYGFERRGNSVRQKFPPRAILDEVTAADTDFRNFHLGVRSPKTGPCANGDRER